MTTTADFITILQGAGTAAKRIIPGPDGSLTTESAKPSYLYRGLEAPVHDLAGLAQLLDRISQDQRLLIVRGALAPGLDRAGFRRTHKQPDPSLLPQAHHWVLLDLDKFLPDLAPDQFVLDPGRYAAQARTLLPPGFRQAQCWWQATGSAGVKYGARLRLGFWLDRPVSDTELNTLEWGLEVDKRLFSPSQPHYTASPVGPNLVPGARTDVLPGQPVAVWPGSAQAKALAGLDKAVKTIAKAKPGERRNVANSVCFRFGAQFGDCLPAHTFDAFCQAAMSAGLSSEEAAHTCHQALTDGAGKHEHERAGWARDLARSEDGRVLPTPGNILLLTRYHPDLAGKLAWDTRKHRATWCGASPWGSAPGQPIEETDISGLIIWLQTKHGIVSGTNLSGARHALDTAAQAHPLPDPLVQYFQELPDWDGVDRLDTFFQRHYHSPDTTLLRAQARAWFIQAYRRALATAPVQADYILVLHGKQSRGKSTGMAALCPDPSYFSDCLPADIASKDARQHLSGLWLVELQELTQRKADQNAFKAFISSRVDKFRLPYARTEVELVRKCVFVATVNESEFVTDRSGGRRFWPAEVCLAESDVPGVVPAIRAERDQVWAEARVRAERGERAHLTPAQEQEAAEAMVEHVDNPFEQVLAERLQDALDRPVPGLAYWQYAPGQVVQALTLDQACRLTGVEHAKVWAIIRAFKLLGWQRKRREDKAKAKIRYWARPETEVQELAHVVVNYQS